MADPSKTTDGPSVSSREAWDYTSLPDFDNDFYSEDDILAFASALSAPDISPSEDNLLSPSKSHVEFITALNDWRPVHQSVKGQQNSPYANRKNKRRKKPQRGVDETREGWTYGLVKYPLLIFVLGWLLFLGIAYLLTRFYIYSYEHYVTWRGKRHRLRKSLRKSPTYEDWVEAAKELDHYLGNDTWKDEDEYAYYDDRTIRRAMERMRRARLQAEKEETGQVNGVGGRRPVDMMVQLAEDCIKNNFAGVENPRLYSETYYGTKKLVQEYIDELKSSTVGSSSILGDAKNPSSVIQFVHKDVVDEEKRAGESNIAEWKQKVKERDKWLREKDEEIERLMKTGTLSPLFMHYYPPIFL